MSVAVRLSDCGAADIDAVMAVMDRAFDPRFGEAWSRAQASGMLGLPGVRLLLARTEGGPAGFALCRSVMDEAELLLLAVSPELRRAGVGRALLAAVEDVARCDGAARLHLEMRDGNPAEALYRAAGFAIVGRRTAYYRGNDGIAHDAISLQRSLVID